MSEAYGVEAMPLSVAIARICMWIQASLGLIGLFLLFVVLGGAPLSVVDGALVFTLLVSTAAIVLPGFLAHRTASRRGWVRVCGLVVEVLQIGVGIWALTGGVSVGRVLSVVLAGIVVAQLCRPSSAMWFNR
ncbi:hypothetical protein ABZ897_36085 [Nonomuraea sp. NPDC046802]|uniref:hypothetical protein n=1 Tax=Nonomuraea sp. NPDC046802 TaxID=3154919 RepID=UPI0033D13A86